MSDHSGANFNSVATVFGQDTAKERMIGCGFHFLQDARRRMSMLPLEQQDRFMQTCKRLNSVSTAWNFLEVQKCLKEYVDSTPALDAWFKWWMARRSHTFSAFVDPDATKANLAEAGNKSFNVRGKSSKLVDATFKDVATVMLQDRQLRYYKTQAMPTSIGRGPTTAQLASKERLQQMKRAEEYGQNLLNMQAIDVELDTQEHFHPSKQTNFKPPPKRRAYGLQGKTTLPSYNAITRAEVLKQIAEIEDNMRDRFPGGVQNIGKPNWKSSPSPNPPTVLLYEDIPKSVSKCQGCKNLIDLSQRHPLDLVMRLRGPSFYYKDGQKMEREGNLYFHCRMACLVKKFPQIESKEVNASDYTFTQMTLQHFFLLDGESLLEAVVSSKKYQ